MRFYGLGFLNNCLISEKTKLYNSIKAGGFTIKRVIQRPRLFLRGNIEQTIQVMDIYSVSPIIIKAQIKGKSLNSIFSIEDS